MCVGVGGEVHACVWARVSACASVCSFSSVCLPVCELACVCVHVRAPVRVRLEAGLVAEERDSGKFVKEVFYDIKNSRRPQHF